MSRPPSPPASPPLVSLVLHSKKALQHGEQLCTRASELSRCSSQEAVELLALDAKVRWIAQGIQDQLKVGRLLWLASDVDLYTILIVGFERREDDRGAEE